MKGSFICLALAILTTSCGMPRKNAGVRKIGREPGQVIFGLKSERALESRNDLSGQLKPLAHIISGAKIVSERVSSAGHITTLDARVQPGVDLDVAIAALRSNDKISFAQANFIYEGSVFDESWDEAIGEDNPAFEKQHHHPVMRNPEAWEVTQGQGIRVAMTDTGIDLDHEDLKDNIWINPGEMGQDDQGLDKSANGFDDDGNGYVDDFHGWDTTEEGDNDPSDTHSHGTHVAGIVAAQANDVGVIGTAPAAQVMAIRFAGTGTWTSLSVAKAYAYAVKNGAHIINTSFNIDRYVTDEVYVNAIKDTYEAGILIFNSAGNFGRQDPPRQLFEHLILVANINTQEGEVDIKHRSSNYGWGIDIGAPGTNILSTVPTGYAVQSGTSMSSPNGAAVAALIWSGHPEWTPLQVAAQLRGSCQYIDDLNPEYQGMLGCGRVDSFNAVTRVLAPPTIRGLITDSLLAGTSNLILEVNSVLDPSTFSQSPILISPNSTGEKKSEPIVATIISEYAAGTNRLRLQTEHPLIAGSYTIQVPETITDPFGTALDGDGDGVGGDAFSQEFEIPSADEDSGS